MRRTAALALLIVAALTVGTASASAPPVGPLPAPRVITVKAKKGSLVAIAAPKRAGYDWRVARAIKATVVRQSTEGDVGKTVVLVFEAVGKGDANVILAETKGETAKAYRAIKYVIHVT